MLTKALITDSNIYPKWNPKIKDFVKLNGKYRGYILLDYKSRVRIDSKSLIPIAYNNNIIFKFPDTFQQNNKYLGQKIRNNISIFLIKYDINVISCIGGESYVYLKINQLEGNYYCNQDKLKQEADFNLKSKNNYCIDYNRIKNINLESNIILNLSKLNCNLIKLINQNKKVKYIIIISCHHTDFWKKIKYLSNFNILTREKICDDNYFITLNLFERKVI